MTDFNDKVNEWLQQSSAPALDTPVEQEVATLPVKQKKSLPKKIIYLIVGVVVGFFVLVGLVTSLCIVFLPKKGTHNFNGYSNVHGFLALAEAPEVDSVITLDENMSQEEQAAYLYRTASTNLKNAPYLVGYNQGALTLSMFGQYNYIDLDAVIMKNQDTYFKVDYHVINDAPLASLSRDTTSCERWYYQSGMESMAAQKVYSSDRDEAGVPFADWSEPENYTKEVPVFTTGQYGIFTVVNHTITADTIKNATVTHNDKGGYWEVTCSLDLSNPASTAYSLADIRTGTGDKKAKYTGVSFIYTVWDSGYMRTFSTREDWNAKVIVSLAFHMDINYYYSYLEEDCDMATYKDFTDAKNAMAPKQ